MGGESCTGHILSQDCLKLMMQNDYYEMFKLSTWQSYAHIYVSIAVHIACGAYIYVHVGGQRYQYVLKRVHKMRRTIGTMPSMPDVVWRCQPPLPPCFMMNE